MRHHMSCNLCVTKINDEHCTLQYFNDAALKYVFYTKKHNTIKCIALIFHSTTKKITRVRGCMRLCVCVCVCVLQYFNETMQL